MTRKLDRDALRRPGEPAVPGRHHLWHEHGARIEYTYQRRVGALTMSPLIATAAATVGVYAGIVGVASTVSCHSSIRNERVQC